MTNQIIDDTIIWNQLDSPGHEFAQILSSQGAYSITGAAIFLLKNKNCHLNYNIRCSSSWKTKQVLVFGTVNDQPVNIEIIVSSDNCWSMNGIDQPNVQGCLDIDLGFTPATNTIPIRRHNLKVGQTLSEKVAWLKFPELTIEPLLQTYSRTSKSKYHYSSGDGVFTADLIVRDSGLVTNYANLWKEEIGI